MAGEWRFHIKKTNTTIIFEDLSEEKWWIKKLCVYLCYYELRDHTLLSHLRNLTFLLTDGRFEYQIDETRVRQNLVPPMSANPDGSIVIRVPVWRIYYSLYGANKTRSMLRDALTHELVHSLHFSINPSLSRISRSMAKLRLKYLQSRSEFSLPMLPHIHIEGFLSAFIYQTALEGFSEIIPKLMGNQLEFTDEQFEKIYSIARQNIELFKKYFDAAKTAADRNDPKLRVIMGNFLGIKYQKAYYSTGQHVFYSILYLQEESLRSDIDALLKYFVSDIGTVTPKRLLALYESLMRKNSKRPVISLQGKDAYLNLDEVTKEWRRLFGNFGKD